VVDDFIDLDEDPGQFLIGWRTARRKTNPALKKQLRKVVGTDTDDLE